MDKEKIINIAKIFSKKVIEFINADKIILYGSDAKGTQRIDSDIDIAIVIKNGRYNFFKTYSSLSRICRETDTRIEPIIIEKNKDYSGFLDTIKKEGIVVYSRT